MEEVKKALIAAQKEIELAASFSKSPSALLSLGTLASAHTLISGRIDRKAASVIRELLEEVYAHAQRAYHDDAGSWTFSAMHRAGMLKSRFEEFSRVFLEFSEDSVCDPEVSKAFPDAAEKFGHDDLV